VAVVAVVAVVVVLVVVAMMLLIATVFISLRKLYKQRLRARARRRQPNANNIGVMSKRAQRLLAPLSHGAAAACRERWRRGLQAVRKKLTG
jgi:hypothetical protein